MSSAARPRRAPRDQAARAARDERLVRALRQQESLRRVIEWIGMDLSLRSLLTRIVRQACDLIGADNGSIGLVDERRGVVRTEAVWRMPRGELGAEMAPGVGIAGQVLLKGRPVVVRRYGDLPAPTQHGLLENAVVGVPIKWRGRMIGFFGIGTAPRPAEADGVRRRAFTRADVDALSEFARHAAIAIQNARQYARERGRAERLALLARIGGIVTAGVRLDEMLGRAANAIHELLGYPNVAIPLLEQGDPDVLVLRTTGGAYRDLVRGEYRLPVTKGIMGAAARSGEIVLVNDVDADPRHFPTPGAVGIRCELAVPILLGRRVLGVLNVESSEPFDEEDVSACACSPTSSRSRSRTRASTRPSGASRCWRSGSGSRATCTTP